MLRYVAFVWDGSNPELAATALTLSRRLLHDSSEWQTALDTHGLRLFVASGRTDRYAAHLLGEFKGAVVGLLFDRRNPLRNSARSPAPYFNENEEDRILASGGRHLVQNYWGRYVAFLGDPSSLHTKVLRDPSGDLPCYRAAVHGVHVYFSSLPDFLQLKSLHLSVNWQHIAARVITGNAWADESALNEVETVHAGECFEHGTRISRQYYWNPYSIATSDPIEDMSTATAEVRSTTRSCAHAWASLHENSVHILSGGLDSSVVLSCLADAPSRPRIHCLNFRTRDPDSDERAYARLAAARACCELTEQERSTSLAVDRVLACLPTVGPVSLIMRGLEVQPLVTQFAGTRRATAVFSGDGGDMLFFHGWPQLAVIDYAHQKGLRTDLFKLACDTALPAQLSVWRLLSDAISHGVLQRKWNIRKVIYDHYRLVTDAVLESALTDIDLLNPWKFPVDNIPPGKILHTFITTRPCLFRDPMTQQPEIDVINPLVSQPVVETCLRIPTYIHAAGGRDRAVERTAFAPDLPREIVLRTWKGAADGHLQAMLAGNINFVRELLMDGALVKQNILDRSRLEECLSGRPTRGGTHATEVFGYVCTEAWLRHWSSPRLAQLE